MKYFVTLNGRTWTVVLEGDRVRVEGSRHHAELRQAGDTPVHMLLLDGQGFALALLPDGRGSWRLQSAGDWHAVQVLDERGAHIRSLVGQGVRAEGPPVLRAPMPGLVVRVLVEPGQKVVEGTSLIVLEAMKMENELKASRPGVVETVLVSPGQPVEKGHELVRFRPTG